MLRERDLVRLLEPSKMTLDQYLDQWLQTAAKPKLLANNYCDCGGLLRWYICPSLGSKPLAGICRRFQGRAERHEVYHGEGRR